MADYTSGRQALPNRARDGLAVDHDLTHAIYGFVLGRHEHDPCVVKEPSALERPGRVPFRHVRRPSSA